ncbi:nose resistant to fluoxetine protein 6-like [Argonauta hians]
MELSSVLWEVLKGFNASSPMINPNRCPLYVNHVISVSFQSFDVIKTIQILIGICIPNSCQQEEIQSFIQNDIHLLPFHIGQNVIATVKCEKEIPYDTKAIVSIVFISLFLFVMFAGTLYDIFTQLVSAQQNNLPTDATKKGEIDQSPGVLVKLLLCFSVYTNGRKLLKTEQAKGTLTCIHGIRFLSLTWVILGHTFVFGISVFRNISLVGEDMNGFLFQAISNAFVSVDTFFLLSGLLVSYGFFKHMESSNGKMNWLYFYCHRIWRLTPPYMLVMMVYIPLFRYWGSGPFWSPEGFENNFCKDTWYYNLLYVNNLVSNSIRTCMAWSWYLANDMQFYIISPILLMALYKSPIIGYVVFFALLLAQMLSAGIISTQKHLSVSIFAKNTLSTEYFQDIYIKPYTRIGPYLIGILYGYYLQQNKCKMYLSKYLSAMIWLMATSNAITVLYGLYNINNGANASQETLSLYTAVHRSVWSVSVGWMIYACCTGYGGFVDRILSWKAFIPLSRLSYCAYLIHPIVIYAFFLNQKYPVFLTNFTAVYFFCGFLFIAYMMAFLVSMAFEAPMIGIERVVLSLFKKRK